MTATLTSTRPSTSTTPDTALRPALWKAGLAAGVVAAAATTAIAAVAQSADVAIVSTAKDAIPVAGFAQLTLAFTIVGILIGRTMARRASRPRATFRTTTVALAALSLVPDLLLSTDAGGKLTLMATHVVAAAIVIPVLVARMPEHRTR